MCLKLVNFFETSCFSLFASLIKNKAKTKNETVKSSTTLLMIGETAISWSKCPTTHFKKAYSFFNRDSWKSILPFKLLKFYFRLEMKSREMLMLMLWCSHLPWRRPRQLWLHVSRRLWRILRTFLGKSPLLNQKLI